MTSRILTGAALFALLILALYFSGWVFALLWITCVCIAMYEIFHALSQAGHRPVAWPTWIALIAAIPGFLLLTDVGSLLLLVIIVVSTSILVSTFIIFRDNPRLEDLLVSVLPLFAVAIPGMSLLGITQLETIQEQRLIMSLAFFIPVVGDSLAFLVGSRFGKIKLNPPISPNKTLEGSVAGLAGSILAAVIIFAVGKLSGSVMPRFTHFLILGLIGGYAGQIGDLFASLVKRHCKIKDFGHIFPGHGGMLDRLDSILFAGTVVYLYQALPFM